MTKPIDVYLEIGKKRTFAGAIDWPGWCRSGQDEESALQALVDYGPRYGKILRSKEFGFQVPTNTSAFSIVERLDGNATTDFGAPGLAPSADAQPLNAKELQRLENILEACWKALNAAIKSANGKELRKGPRGGGRELGGIIQHVLEADGGYLSSLGWKIKQDHSMDLREAMRLRQKEMSSGLVASAYGEIPSRGPRGGLRWTPRYYVRRAAWHILDHVWEIQDRIE